MSVDDKTDDNSVVVGEQKLSRKELIIHNIKQNKHKLIGATISVALISMVGYFAYNALFSKNSTDLIFIPDVPSGGKAGDFVDNNEEQGSEELLKNIDKREKDKAKKALESGGSFVSTVSAFGLNGTQGEQREPVNTEKIIRAIKKQESVKRHNTTYNNARQKQLLIYTDEDTKNTVKAARAEIKALLLLLKSGNNSKGVVLASYAPKKQNSNSATAQVTTRSDQSNTQQAVIPSEQQTLISIGDTLYAKLIYSLNTDFATPVTAEIINAKQTILDKAIIRGVMEHNKAFDKIVLKFSSIHIKQKGIDKQYGFEAIVIDPDSDLAAVADDVDYHYFDRLILPVLLKGLSGATDVFINQGIRRTRSTIGGDDSGLVDEQFEGGDKQIIGGLIKGGVKGFQDHYAKRTSRGVTVSKDKAYILKLIALSPVVIEK